MKKLSTPNGFVLYSNLRVDFFSTSVLLCTNLKNRRRIFRAKPNFYVISDNPNVSLGPIYCSLYTRLTVLKDDYKKKRMDILAYFRVKSKYLETLVKIFINLARQNDFFQENTLNNAPVRRIAIVMHTNSAFTDLYTQKPSCYQKSDFTQLRKPAGGQQNVDFDAADNCRFYVTTLKAMLF